VTTTAPTATAIRNRSITTEHPVGTDDQGRQVLASLHSSHNRERGHLVAILSRVTMKPNPTTGVTFAELRPMESIAVGDDPIIRYSDKALAAFHERALAKVEQLKAAGSNPRVNAIYAA